NYTTGSSVKYRCHRYHILEGPETVHCVQGKWTAQPTCLDPKEKCGSPPIIKNGDVIDPRLTEYESDSSVEYTCFDHHFLQGSNRVYCSNGQWTTPPDCIEPCILSKDVMDKNNLILRWSFDDKSYSFHGEYIEFLCKENHYGAPSTSVFDFRIQCSRGQLTYPRCVERGR
uniref:Sushi domain-containing protein n=1 Tax=Chrysemys picta bellii TaxID=8478 RepID=A0A8C3IYS3_CHRPI